jgi:hypothetical protein
MNRNYAKRRNGEYVHSMAARRHRELAWALYVAEGYAANLRNALTVNAYTLDRAALRTLRACLQGAEQHCKALRAELTG